MTYAITNPLALGFEALTDVAEIQLAGLMHLGAAWAIASSVRTALARRLGVEVRELGIGVSPRRDGLGGRTHSIHLFDANAGGAGYAPRLLDDVEGLLREAAQILDCPRACSTGCSRCVLVADLHAQQGILDRRAALEVVNSVLAAVARPRAEDMAGDGCVLSKPIADAVARRVRPKGVVTIWLGDEFDLSALPEPPFSTLLAAISRAGAALNMVLPEVILGKLDEAARAGLRNASHRFGFTIHTGDGYAAPNGARLIAALVEDTRTTGFLSRDTLAATAGSGWGKGVRAPVVEMPLDPPSYKLVEAEKLERNQLGDRVRLLSGDAG